MTERTLNTEKNCREKHSEKVQRSVDKSRSLFRSRQREDDTRFILESCEDMKKSSQSTEDKERHVRGVCVYVCVCTMS